MISSNSFFEVIAIKDHKPVHQSQLAFKKGAKFIVVEQLETGWSRGEYNGKSGLFPQSYVIPVETTVVTTGDSNESPELASIEYNKPDYDNNNQFLPPPPLHSLISVTNLNINDIKIGEFINNLPPPPLNQQQQQQSDVSVHQATTTSTSPPPPLMPVSQHPKTITKSPRLNYINIQQQVQQMDLSKSNGRPQSPSVKVGSPGNQSPTTYQFNTISNTRSSTQQQQQQQHDVSNTNNVSPITTAPTTNQQVKGHSRKNSGPSTSISSVDEASDEKNNNTGTIDGGSIVNSAVSAADKFKTMPSNSNRTRSPLLNNNRIGMKDINPEIPYYITRAMEPFQKKAFDELEVNTGDLILVYNSKDIDSDFWVGKIKSTFGVFPKKIVEIIKDISPEPTVLSPPLSSQAAKTSQQQYQQQQQTQKLQNQLNQPITPSVVVADSTYRKGIAVTTYNSQFANYLSFKKGDEIVLIKKEGDFWRGRIGNQIGLISPNYVQEVQMPSVVQKQPPTPTSTINQTQNNNITQTQPPKQTNNVHPIPVNSIKPTPTPTPTSNDTTSEEETIALRIKESMSQFQTREELLNAIQNLAIKFVKQTTTLKKELAEEKAKTSNLQSEISLLESEIELLKKE